MCGGCAWQHIAYPEQLRLKTGIVGRLVREAVPSAPEPLPMMAATSVDDPWNFRQKVHFVFEPPSPRGVGGPGRRQGGGLIMGHYARGSRRVMPVQECPVHDERGNAVAFGLLESYAHMSGPAPQTLKSVAVRASVSKDETMATLVVTDDTDKRLRDGDAAGADGELGAHLLPRQHPSTRRPLHLRT